jgi:hypothetical protein
MYRNFQIYKTDTNTFVVKADSKRFGKQAIVFESYNAKDCWKWIQGNYMNKEGKRITNMRCVDRVYRKAFSTCDNGNVWYRMAHTA